MNLQDSLSLSLPRSVSLFLFSLVLYISYAGIHVCMDVRLHACLESVKCIVQYTTMKSQQAAVRAAMRPYSALQRQWLVTYPYP